jgi:hypothetical protein
MPTPASGAEFRAAFEQSPVTPALVEQLGRFASFDEWINQDAAIHWGDLALTGTFRAPALATIVIGRLSAEVVDLASGFDEGGLFMVIGDVDCRHFIGNYGVCSFIDGDLAATDCILNGYSDSALSVMGTLRTRLFIGADIWAEVGCGAIMEYGVGYCLPIGNASPQEQAIRPLHSEAETADLVLPEPQREGYLLRPEPFADRIRAGRQIFR